MKLLNLLHGQVSVWYIQYTYLTQFTSEVERLQEGVHVAGCSLILEANISCVFLGVPPMNINIMKHKVQVHAKLSEKQSNFNILSS